MQAMHARTQAFAGFFSSISLTLQHETQVAALPKEVATEVFQFLQGVKDWYFEEA